MATEKTKKTHKKREGDRDTSWHDRFIELLAQTCNVTLAAKGAGVSRSAAYVHRSLFGDFAARWDSAEQEAIEVLEAEAWRRARRTSDTLLIFLLKAHKPNKYRENYTQYNLNLNLSELSDEQLERIAAGAPPESVIRSGGSPIT